MNKDLKKKILKLKLAAALGITLATNNPIAKAEESRIEFNVETWGNPEFGEVLYHTLEELPQGLNNFFKENDTEVVLLEGESSADYVWKELFGESYPSSITGFTATDDYSSTVYVEASTHNGYYEKYEESSKGLTPKEFNSRITKNTLLHELGHAVDENLNCSLSGNDNFYEIFIEEAEQFKDTISFKIDSYQIYANISTASEYFASSFAAWKTYPDDLKKNCPKTYQYIEDNIKAIIEKYDHTKAR